MVPGGSSAATPSFQLQGGALDVGSDEVGAREGPPRAQYSVSVGDQCCENPSPTLGHDTAQHESGVAKQEAGQADIDSVGSVDTLGQIATRVVAAQPNQAHTPHTARTLTALTGDHKDRLFERWASERDDSPNMGTDHLLTRQNTGDAARLPESSQQTHTVHIDHPIGASLCSLHPTDTNTNAPGCPLDSVSWDTTPPAVQQQAVQVNDRAQSRLCTDARRINMVFLRQQQDAVQRETAQRLAETVARKA